MTVGRLKPRGPSGKRVCLWVTWVLVLLGSPVTIAAEGGAGGRASKPPEPIEIGSRLELFVDGYLIEQFSGGARLTLHHPVPRDVAIVFDKPWEGSGCGYHSVFQDGDLYRMYYRGWQLTVEDGKRLRASEPVLCYAQSRDGIHWVKPDLGVVELADFKENNVVMAVDTIEQVGGDPAHVAVFKDANPDCPAESKYKAIVRSRSPKGLLAFHSADGIHWAPMSDKPVITKGAFDSQNLAFWDPVRSEYRAYFRDFREGVRDIRTAVSEDFLHWSEPEFVECPGAPKEHLYTNQIKPYYRAPHVLIGLPTRYVDRGWSTSMESLPELEHRKLRAGASRRYGTALSESLLMTSRDGRTFHRWHEAFLRPGPERKDSWAYGDHYVAWQLVETQSALEGAPNELSFYASEGYWTGTSSRLRRYTLRIDGFVSVCSPLEGGELVTRPLVFDGRELVLNFSTSAAGSVRVEVQDAAGAPVDGYTLDQCPEIFGDTIERTVHWESGSDVGGLAGRPVRLRFELKDADLFSFRFR